MGTGLGVIRRLHRALDALVLAVTVPLMVVMLGCVVWQVLGRYFFGASTSYTDEIARFTFIWVSLLGAAYVLGRRGHIAITALTQLLSFGPRRVLEWIIALLVVGFSVAVMVYGGYALTERAARLVQVSPALQVSMGLVYSVIPISGALTALYAALVLAQWASGGEVAEDHVSLD